MWHYIWTNEEWNSEQFCIKKCIEMWLKFFLVTYLQRFKIKEHFFAVVMYSLKSRSFLKDVTDLEVLWSNLLIHIDVCIWLSLLFIYLKLISNNPVKQKFVARKLKGLVWMFYRLRSHVVTRVVILKPNECFITNTPTHPLQPTGNVVRTLLYETTHRRVAAVLF